MIFLTKFLIFSALETLVKLLRVTEMAHTIKSERDSYHDAKRTSAEIRLFKEIRKIKNLARETYLISRKNRVELANQRKILDGLALTIKEIGEPATVDANIAKMNLEPIPEQEELEAEATVLENYLDDMDEDKNLSDVSLIIDEDLNEDEVAEELYPEIKDPDSSIHVDKIVALKPHQEIARKRRLDIEKEVEFAGFHGLPDQGWSFKNYVDLQDRIQAQYAPVRISAPSKPGVFRKRYGTDWLPSMTNHADFGGSRGENPRIQKPLGWKDRVAQEKAALEEVQEVKVEDDVEKQHAKIDKMTKNGGKGKKSKLTLGTKKSKLAKATRPKFVMEDNPADNARIDDIFDDTSSDDFQNERSPVKLRSQEKLKTTKRKADEPMAGTSKKPKKSARDLIVEQHAVKWKKHPHSLSGRVVPK